jgi:hypothetical protein
VKIAGHPAKKPSFWINRADFVRQYQRIDGFWLPCRDETSVDVKMYGRGVFTVDHQQYVIDPANHREAKKTKSLMRIAHISFSSHISFWNDATSYLDQILDANPDNIDEILDDPNLRDSRKETATVSGRRKCVKRGQWVETGPTEMTDHTAQNRSALCQSVCDFSLRE